MRTINLYKKIKKNCELLILLLFLIWILFSLLRTFLNVTKVYSEERFWVNYSEVEKKIRLFGDIHIFLTLLKSKTALNDYITLYTDDKKAHYYAKYVLYPRKVKVIEIEKDKIELPIDNRIFSTYFAKSVGLTKNLKQMLKNDYELIYQYVSPGGEIGKVYIKK